MRSDTPTAAEKARYRILIASPMYLDAAALLVMVRNLRKAISHFTRTYSPDTCEELFQAAGCANDRPDDYDCATEWSDIIFNDVAGFAWALDMIHSVLDSHVAAPDALNQEGDDAQELADVPAVVAAG